MSSKIFISYRRDDSRYPARRIYDSIQLILPPGSVFMDVDSIALGVDFAETLEGWVKQCDLVLALIGPNWITATDRRTGQRRIDNPDDFVRHELRLALALGIPVVPVLLDGADMPSSSQLPDDIKDLRHRNAEFVMDRTFDVDVQRLIRKLQIGDGRQRSLLLRKAWWALPRSPRKRFALAGGTGVVMAVAALPFVWPLLFPGSGPRLLADEMGKVSRWAVDGKCDEKDKTFTISYPSPSQLKFVRDDGKIDTEQIIFNGEHEIITRTTESNEVPLRTDWAYSRSGDIINVRKNGRDFMKYQRCPAKPPASTSS